MKKIITLMVLCLIAFVANAQEGVTYSLRTLTFEDTNNSNYWASKIDSPQYGGNLLYGNESVYQWIDSNNTMLCSAIPFNYGSHQYWGGGHAISNYWEGNLENGDYLHQLAVYTPDDNLNGQGGHGYNNSNNFAVHYGYSDGSLWNMTETLPYFEFSDNVARTIQNMYVAINTYLANTIVNGNSLTSNLGETDYIAIEATGYRANGSTMTQTFYLADGPDFFITNWTPWDLSEMGDVKKVEFNIIGSNDNGYGFSQPAYFCYDNVSVRFPLTNQNIVMTAPKASENSDQTITITPDASSINWLSGDLPDGINYEFNSDYDVPSYLQEGQSYTLTLKGLPKNATITRIDVSGYCEQRLGKATISAYIGTNEIASKKYGGTKANHGEVVGQTLKTMTMDLIPDVSKTCTDNLFIKALCEGKNMSVRKYEIHYILESPTGINNKIYLKDNSNLIFDLQGHRVNNLRHGFYVIDGKKIMVK